MTLLQLFVIPSKSTAHGVAQTGMTDFRHRPAGAQHAAPLPNLSLVVSPQRVALLEQEENLSGEAERNAKTPRYVRREEIRKDFASRSSQRLCVDIILPTDAFLVGASAAENLERRWFFAGHAEGLAPGTGALDGFGALPKLFASLFIRRILFCKAPPFP